MALVESKELSEKDKKNSNAKAKNKRRKERRRDKCKQCEDDNFSSAQKDFSQLFLQYKLKPVFHILS